MTNWHQDEEVYLKQLSNSCQALASRYKQIYNQYSKRETFFKLPIIVLSSITGLLSFGNGNFESISHQLNLTCGVISVCVTIINSIEAYLRIGVIMSTANQASLGFQKLKEDIDVELSISTEERSSNGITFLRECYSKYEKIYEAAPNLHKVRFIKPNENVIIEMSGSESSSDTPKSTILSKLKNII